MNGDTLLLRQVNPAWIQLSRVTSQVFKPTPKDQKRLSVYDGDLITARESWRHFTEILAFASAGVLGVSVNECGTLELTAEPDPKPFPQHAVIDYGECSSGQIEKKAKQLRVFAEARGWLCRCEVDA